MTPETGKLRFHEQLEVLQDRLMEMAGGVEEQVRVATDGVLGRERGILPAVIEADRRTDELEVEIDTRVIDLLALQQPMASDLRMIFASLKISNDLERVGDHAVSIARSVERLASHTPIPDLRELTEMVAITREMLSDSLASFVGRSPGVARMVCATDDQVDDLRSSLYRILVSHMLEDPGRISAALELLLVAHNLERIADLSTNVAEDVVFLVEGRSIKHGAGEAIELP